MARQCSSKKEKKKIFKEDNLYFCDGTIHAEKYTKIRARYCFRQDSILSRHMHAFCRQCKTAFLYALQNHGCKRGCGCWSGLPAILTCPIENVWRILKRKMQERQLKMCLQEEWDKITPESLHRLVFSVPKRLLSVVRMNGNIIKGFMLYHPNILRYAFQARNAGKDLCYMK